MNRDKLVATPVAGSVIFADGTTVPVSAANPGKGFTLTELRTAIGAKLIEIVRSDDPRMEILGMVLVCDEEGLIRGLPLNPLASSIAGRPLVGAVFLCESGHIA